MLRAQTSTPLRKNGRILFGRDLRILPEGASAKDAPCPAALLEEESATGADFFLCALTRWERGQDGDSGIGSDKGPGATPPGSGPDAGPGNGPGAGPLEGAGDESGAAVGGARLAVEALGGRFPLASFLRAAFERRLPLFLLADGSVGTDDARALADLLAPYGGGADRPRTTDAAGAAGTAQATGADGSAGPVGCADRVGCAAPSATAGADGNANASLCDLPPLLLASADGAFPRAVAALARKTGVRVAACLAGVPSACCTLPSTNGPHSSRLDSQPMADEMPDRASGRLSGQAADRGTNPNQIQNRDQDREYDAYLLTREEATGCRLCGMRALGHFVFVLGACTPQEVLRLSVDGADAFCMADPGPAINVFRKRRERT